MKARRKPKRRQMGAVEEAEGEVERIASSVVDELGIPIIVDFVEAKDSPLGVPFGKERIDAFGVRFKALAGRLKSDKTYVRAEDFADHSPRVKEHIREFLTRNYEPPEAS